MRRMLLLFVSLLLVSSIAVADHIGIFSDATGSSCLLPAGFTTTCAVVHRYSLGATASRWYIDSSSLIGAVFAFSTSYTTTGSFDNILSVGYGTCLTGTFPLGTLIMATTSGWLSIKGFPGVIYTDCNLVEHSATAGRACVGCGADPCPILAAEPSTWGRVKSLYR